MPRKLKDGIILGVCELCQNTEIPEQFANWVGISCVSACLERNCFIDQGHFIVYPNLYVVLAAASARCRKSSAITIAEDILRGVVPPVNMLFQKGSPEALIGELSGSFVEKGSTTVKTLSSGIIIIDELSTFIDKKAFDSGMVAVLTKLYDCRDFEYKTRLHGSELVKNPCLGILGGSTLHWIKEAIPVVAIGGGFTARIVFVYQEKRKKNVPWPGRSPEEFELQEKIASDLSQVRLLKGPFGITKEAKELYCQEYCEFCDKSKLFEDPNMSGYAGRRHVMVLKLAMIMSASRNDSREITDLDVALAIKQLFLAEQEMQKVLSAISSEPCGSLSEQLVQIIANNVTVSRFELVRTFRSRLKVHELDELLQVLIEAKFIEMTSDRGTVKYKWIGKVQE